MARQVLYVDPTQGQDDQDGRSAAEPLKTITAALRLGRADTVIRLKAGLYTAASGEQFPLVVPAGCELVGEAGSDRPATVVQGSGHWQTPNLGTQSVSCILRDGAELKEITVMNTQSRGVGIWIEAGRTSLRRVTVLNCPHYGVVISGQALPTIQDSTVEECELAGIAFFARGKGELERVTCRGNGDGVLVQEAAAPLIQNCQLEQNTGGLAIAGTANPVLRQNRILRNRTYGIQLTDRSTADLGQSQDPGRNVVRQNGQVDIDNKTGRSLVACGNDLVPQGLRGAVDLVASTIPDPSAVPPLLFEQLATLPPTTSPEPEPSEPSESIEVSGSEQFRDMRQHWAGPFVDGLVQADAAAGFDNGTFRPDQAVTRAEFAAFVLASFPDRPHRRPAVRFRDVPADFWGREALTQAQQTGFLSGFPDNTMRPQQPMTRIQAIVALVNGLGLTGGRVDDIGLYRDRAQVPSYAVESLATATQQRLVVNYPDPLTLRPLETLTRGEVSALVYQGRVAIGQSAAIASPYIVRPDTTQPRFSDLEGHWAAAFIRGLATANLVNGMDDGRFAPDAPMTRAQFAALLVNAFQPQPQRPPTVFSDVPNTFWGAAAIQSAYRGEFMSGFPDDTFGPHTPLLRVQVWVSLVNGLGWDDPSIALNPLGQFSDYTAIPRYALRPTAIALQRQIIASHPDRTQLRPNQVATRADVSVAVYQALVAQQRLPAIASSAIVGS